MAREELSEEIKLRVTAETKKRINEIADSREPGAGDSESAVVREAIREYLAAHHRETAQATDDPERSVLEKEEQRRALSRKSRKRA